MGRAVSGRRRASGALGSRYAGCRNRFGVVALPGDTRSRRPESAPAARPRRHGPRLRGAARRPRRGRRGPHLAGPFQPELQGGVPGDAAPLLAAPAGRAFDGPAARDRSRHHRDLLRRRLHEPRDVQPDVSRHRGRAALELPPRARTDRGAQLLPARGHATGRAGLGRGSIEQFWRSPRGGRSPSIAVNHLRTPRGGCDR